MEDLMTALMELDASALFLLSVTVLAFLVPVVIILPPVRPSKSDALLQTHSLAAVAPARSGLRTQYSEKAHAGSVDGRPPAVQALVVYPIKSCRGVEVTKARVLPQGLQYDRLFTFAQLKSQFPVPVDEVDGDDNDDEEKEKSRHSWTFITQRQFARLATLEVELWLPDEMKLRKQSIAHTDEAFLILRFPWRARGFWRGLADTVSARLTKGLLRAGPRSSRGLHVRGRDGLGRPRHGAQPGGRLPEELRLYLGVSNKLGLFRIDPAHLRENNHGNAPKRDDLGWQPVSAFQDGVSPNVVNLLQAKPPRAGLAASLASSASSASASAPASSASASPLSRTQGPSKPQEAEIDHGGLFPTLNNFPQYPLHIQNISSVQAFSKQVPKDPELKQLSVMRFRPNIIDPPGARDLGPLPPPAARHILPNDALPPPQRGPGHGRPPPAPARQVPPRPPQRRPGRPPDGCLGVQACPLFEDAVDEEDREGWIGVGMEVEVEKRGDHFYRD
ncbi:hypothetical protein G7054_g7874 [Neopestalotiopsis clavispora]|nr:hypothetical protein G7054_g7874 [Neopestalotiopsis clavispora]